MTIEYIKENLCTYIQEGEKQPINCLCDNCFYGRHELALELLRVIESNKTI